MAVFAAALLLALTRAEIIERFRAPVVTQVDGLVRVTAACSADMRRDYQLPVAGFVSGVCRTLYAAQMRRSVKFTQPGIVVAIGDVRTNVTNVVARAQTRADGSRFMRILVPAPGFADRRALRIAAAQGFFLAVDGRTVDEATALQALRDADPALRAADDRRDLARWRTGGGYTEGRADEAYLALQRKILSPGRAPAEDVAVFASRLFLYPPYYALPFAGTSDGCTFAEAIRLAARDPIVRYMALRKVTEIALYGGGRGEALSAAADAYIAFLRALAAGRSTPEELTALLAAADEKLKGVHES
jgi:hypothetical protein